MDVVDFTSEAAEISADKKFSHDIEVLAQRPRLITELLSEVGAERGLRTYLEEKIQRYLEIPDSAIAVADAFGVDRNAA